MEDGVPFGERVSFEAGTWDTEADTCRELLFEAINPLDTTILSVAGVAFDDCIWIAEACKVSTFEAGVPVDARTISVVGMPFDAEL